MKFKIFYNDKTKELDINCLEDEYTDIILPKNMNQHVSYPIPAEAKKQIYKDLKELITDDMKEEFDTVINKLKSLNEEKTSIINKFRTELNPKIIETCHEYKDRFPEYFI